jgi:hypothetical protein
MERHYFYLDILFWKNFRVGTNSTPLAGIMHNLSLFCRETPVAWYLFPVYPSPGASRPLVDCPLSPEPQ